MLWKLCVLVAFGLSDTVTATDVAKDQPKKESLVSECSRNEDEQATEPVEVTEPTKTETDEPPKYSFEWYFLPKEENRKHLFDRLPECSQRCLPKNFSDPINPKYEQRIREYLLMYSERWYMLSKPENRTALRYLLPEDLAVKVPEDCNEPLDGAVKELIRTHLSSGIKKQRAKRFFFVFLTF